MMREMTLISPSTIEPSPARARFQGAVREFAKGAMIMADNGNTEQIDLLVTRLTAAMEEHSSKRTPGNPFLLAIASTIVGLVVTGLVGYGSITSRVTALESRSTAVDKVAGIEAKLDAANTRLEAMEKRFNEFMDSQARQKR